jgi:hypothetical protein
MNYDLQDADGFERGYMGKGKPKTKRIYQFVRKEGNLTHVTSMNAWGRIFNESFLTKTLMPYTAKKCS